MALVNDFVYFTILYFTDMIIYEPIQTDDSLLALARIL